MHKFNIVQIFARTAAEGDILVATYGNFSVLRPPKVVASQNIVLPPLVNNSNLNVSGHARIHVNTTTFASIELPALSNSSVLAGGSPVAAFVQVAERPPDVNLRLPAFTNNSVLEGGSPLAALVAVDLTPPPGNIRLPVLTNNSILQNGSPVVADVSVEELSGGSPPPAQDEEEDGMIADGMAAGRMI